MDICGKKQRAFGCDYIATGHYAKTEYSEKYKTWVLKRSNANQKDQSYVLWSIPKELLEHIIFPLADFESKEEIRKIAKENNLKVASKPDSEDICFIPDGNYKKFLKENSDIQERKGNIVLRDGTIVGTHTGIINYTIGQRKGLGISYKEPLYVLKLDKEKNEVVVGTEKEIYNDTLYAEELNFLVDFDKWENDIFAKIRYSAKPAKAKVEKKDKTLKATFDTPQKAITKGQSVVFYDEMRNCSWRRKNNLTWKNKQ